LLVRVELADVSRFLIADDDDTGSAYDIEIIGRVESVSYLARQMDFTVQPDLPGSEV
jgi:hypothetical protein